MASKFDLSKRLRPQHAIRQHEIAFLVREYLKQLGCHATVHTFLKEHPPAAKAKIHQNKPVLTLKDILDSYLTMRHREQHLAALVQELTETNTLLKRVLDQQLCAHGSQDLNHHARADPLLPGDAYQGSGCLLYDDGAAEVDPLAHAYEMMLADTRAAETIADELNRAMHTHHHGSADGVEVADRDDVGRERQDGLPGDDASGHAIYDQVMESDAINNLIDDILLPMDDDDGVNEQPFYAEAMMNSYFSRPATEAVDEHAPRQTPEDATAPRPTKRFFITSRMGPGPIANHARTSSPSWSASSEEEDADDPDYRPPVPLYDMPPTSPVARRPTTPTYITLSSTRKKRVLPPGAGVDLLAPHAKRHKSQ